MGLKAQQIMDFNNIDSVAHSEFSIKSFEPVKNLINIQQVQCVTPDTLPVDYYYGDSKKRTVFEQACFASHYNLMLKLSKGQELFIMEHDAYLWPQDVSLFKFLISQFKAFEVFYIGISNEFYTVSQQVAQAYVRQLRRNRVHGGPMFHLGRCYEMYVKKPGMLVCIILTISLLRKNIVALGFTGCCQLSSNIASIRLSRQAKVL